MALTIAVQNAVQSLTPDDVMSVYSGKAGRCCCGCSGKHRYNSAYRAEASKDRGYKINNDEINDVQVRRVLKVMKEHAGSKSASAYGCHYSVVIDNRLYVVYLLKEHGHKSAA